MVVSVTYKINKKKVNALDGTVGKEKIPTREYKLCLETLGMAIAPSSWVGIMSFNMMWISTTFLFEALWLCIQNQQLDTVR